MATREVSSWDEKTVVTTARATDKVKPRTVQLAMKNLGNLGE